MSKIELQSNIKRLLFNAYIDPVDREKLLPTLTTLTEADLAELNTTLQQFVSAQQDVEGFLGVIGEAVDKSPSQGDGSANTKPHPLYGLTPENIADILNQHALDYIKQSINIRDEYELYLASLRQIIENDPEHDPGTTIQEVRLAVLAGLTSCQQTITGDSSERTVAKWLELYDNEFKIEKSRRSSFEELSFVRRLNLAAGVAAVLQEVLATYDYILYTDAAAEDPNVVRDLAKNLNATPKREDTPKENTRSATEGPITAKSVKQLEPLEAATVPIEKLLTIPTNVKEAPIESKKQTIKLPEAIKAAIAETPVTKLHTPSPTLPQTPSAFLGSEVLAQAKKIIDEKTSPAEALHRAVQGRQPAAVFAAMKILAEAGTFKDVMKRDQRIESLLKDSYQRQSRTNDLESLRLGPTNPQHLKNLVQFILVEQLRLSENDSAHVAVDLVNTMNRSTAIKIAPWAYYDMESSGYKWL